MTTKSQRQGRRKGAAGDADAGERSLSHGALDDLLGYWVRRLHAYLSSGIADVVEGEGLRLHQLSTLSLIVDNPAISQIELARTLGVKPSNIVPLVDELQERGLVLRNAATDMRRKYALAATEQGRRKRDQALQRMAEYENGMLAVLQPDERKALLNLVRKIGLEAAGKDKTSSPG